ncbi:hypothetical protein [Spartinivicinus poritis]|uniref:Phage tail protein n=1 Tax=Spartinivicinus poritis TaxID=2994640 RepID=A0ABT5UEQ4_9GAMM|nr:hypothetical protein [Spartinivicinus sp. A2-2]MDE1464792.1 hypothetical protein [Spartinivicinus sp. A2-2]
MTSGVDISFAQEIARANRIIQAAPKQLEKASQRAMRKTIRWLKSRMAREISKTMKVPQKVIKERFKDATTGKGVNKVFTLWIGTLPLAAEQVSKPRQTNKGVSVRSHRFEGAFYKPVFDGQAKVWIRSKRNLTLNYPSLNPKKKKAIGQVPKHLKGRFPIQRIGVPIDGVTEELFKRYKNRAVERFSTLLQQELNYAVNHER